MDTKDTKGWEVQFVVSIVSFVVNAFGLATNESVLLAVLSHEILDAKLAEVRQRRAELLARPIPPRDPKQRFLQPIIESEAESFCGDACHDRKWRDVFADDCPRADPRARTDADTGQNHGAVADPDVMTQCHLVPAAPVEKLTIIL